MYTSPPAATATPRSNGATASIRDEEEEEGWDEDESEISPARLQSALYSQIVDEDAQMKVLPFGAEAEEGRSEGKREGKEEDWVSVKVGLVEGTVARESEVGRSRIAVVIVKRCRGVCVERNDQ